MCIVVVDGCKNAIYTAVSSVTNSAGTLNRTFVKVTNDLFGENYGAAIQKAVYGLPVTIAGLYLPWTWLVPIIVSIAVVHIVLDKNPLSTYSYQIVFRGIGNIGLTRAIIHTAEFAKTGTSAYVAAIAMELLWAKSWYLVERLLAGVVE